MAKKTASRAAASTEQKTEEKSVATENEAAKTEVTTEAETKTESVEETKTETATKSDEPAKQEDATDEKVTEDPTPDEPPAIDEPMTTCIAEGPTLAEREEWEKERRFHDTVQLTKEIYVTKVSSMNARNFDCEHFLCTSWAEAERFIEFIETKKEDQAE